MKGQITITVDKKGLRKIFFGPEISRKQQRQFFHDVKTGACPLPKDASSVEIYELQRVTIGNPKPEQPAPL